MKDFRSGCHAALRKAQYLLASLLLGACANDAPAEAGIVDTDSNTPVAAVAVPGGRTRATVPMDQPAGELLTEPLSAGNYTLDGTTAFLRTAAGTVPLSSADGLFDRVWVPENEPVDLHVHLPGLRVGEEVAITAPHGGKVEREGGPLRFIARQAEVDLALSFTPTLGRGAYSIAVRHAGAVVTFNLWVGAALPVGLAGPDYVPSQPEKEIVP